MESVVEGGLGFGGFERDKGQKETREAALMNARCGKTVAAGQEGKGELV